MAVRRPPPSPMEDDESRVEAKPAASQPAVRRRIGKLDDEGSVSLAAPTPIRKGRGSTMPGAVGFRAAPESSTDVSDKAVEAKTESRKRLRKSRDEHRQRVWDKLDEARRRAEEKRPRVDKFRPPRGR